MIYIIFSISTHIESCDWILEPVIRFQQHQI